MAERTAIEWVGRTWSPVWGCHQISPACDHCYAMVLANRWGYGWNGPYRLFGDAHWEVPLRWNRSLTKAGKRDTVFPSMCDPFDKDWPTGTRDRFWELIANTPAIDWLLLTKRVGNVVRLVPQEWMARWPSNVRIGSTVVTQEEFDRDIVKLLVLPSPNFISIEPMLEPINMRLALAVRSVLGPPLLHWVIVGAESGPHARPLRVDWVRSIVQQCKAAGVPVLVKQLGRRVLDRGMSGPGEHWPVGLEAEELPRRDESDPPRLIWLKQSKGNDPMEWPEDLRVREFPASPPT